MEGMAAPLPITSRQNQRVKDAVRLRTGRDRAKQGRFVIDGAREIERALAAGIRPVEAFISEPIFARRATGEMLVDLRSAGGELLYVTPEVYERLCFGDRDETGIVVVAETPRRRLDHLTLPADPLVVVIEGIEKPGNLGAILRSADGAGVDAVVVADGGTDLFNPNTIRASLGTLFRDSVVEATSAETIQWLGKQGVKVVTARPDAETLFTAANLCGGVAIVLGSEAAGLTDAWRGVEFQAVRLPMRGVADSLNVSTTAAVLFYEALRQRDND
jgi:TrmH family RNA methyltransferase